MLGLGLIPATLVFFLEWVQHLCRKKSASKASGPSPSVQDTDLGTRIISLEGNVDVESHPYQNMKRNEGGNTVGRFIISHEHVKNGDPQ